MSKSRSSEQQQAPAAPQQQPVDIQQSLFGDMMARQQANRQAQINQRLERQRGYGMPQGMFGFQQQIPQDWLGLLAQLGQQQAQQGVQYSPQGLPIMPEGMSPQDAALWRDRNSSSLWGGS